MTQKTKKAMHWSEMKSCQNNKNLSIQGQSIGRHKASKLMLAKGTYLIGLFAVTNE